MLRTGLRRANRSCKKRQYPVVDCLLLPIDTFSFRGGGASYDGDIEGLAIPTVQSYGCCLLTMAGGLLWKWTSKKWGKFLL